MGVQVGRALAVGLADGPQLLLPQNLGRDSRLLIHNTVQMRDRGNRWWCHFAC